MINQLDVAGGVYWENVSWPKWFELYGSGGRAAAALSGGDVKIVLHTYATDRTRDLLLPLLDSFEVDSRISRGRQDIDFTYFDCLAEPEVRPGYGWIEQNVPLRVDAEHVLRFGMLEGSAIVDARSCVYDPQCPFAPEPFAKNGSRCEELGLVANLSEICLLGKNDDPTQAAQNLLKQGAAVVVVKRGPDGAEVVTSDVSSIIPAFATENVWTIGSGDVFSASFAAAWSIEKMPAADAAEAASRAVAYYASTKSVPCYPSPISLAFQPTKRAIDSVYLAGPFFSMSQLWLIERAKRAFEENGVKVFSPYHDVGKGDVKDAKNIATKDIDGLHRSDVLFAIIDGLDAGTLFEIGFARALNKPVWILSQAVKPEDLTMFRGTDCHILDDFVSAVYRTVWQQ